MEDKSALKARLAMRPTTAPTILGTVPMMGMVPVDNDYASIDRMSPNALRKRLDARKSGPNDRKRGFGSASQRNSGYAKLEGPSVLHYVEPWTQ
mmetsp:Transcript_36147/g.75594  ORF Transcript_36147/g.75594 Transcript_36147/m.75594 type:complete len:94 (+) Transcript_36147:1-282(+)